jgi:drug/metabolite transporter (DMT)-like permease
MPGSRIRSRETAGFAASLVFTCLAAVRDVYFGGLFQAVSPLGVAVVAFTLCSVLFLPVALVARRASLRVLLRHPGELVWVNVTTGLAWIAFFYALRTIEPLLVQILFAGVGPLSVLWLDRFVGLTPAAALAPSERSIYVGLGAALLLAAGVAVGGLSGAGSQDLATAALGVGLATAAGVSISVSTVLSRRLNDAGVAPAALMPLRFVGAIVMAGGLAMWTGGSPAGDKPPPYEGFDPVMLGAIVVLIVVPNYVNQVGVSLASPLTVRAVMALTPVLIFGLQLAERRLTPSPFSLSVAVLYAIFALSAAIARRRQLSISAPGGASRCRSAGSARAGTWRSRSRGRSLPGR